jgi:PadR family transcriptional regulator PadR
MPVEIEAVPVLQGTLDMLILKTLAWGPNHGFGILRHIEQVTGEQLHVEEGALYPALHRMHRRGWLEAEWGLSENNRRARYYRLSPEGQNALREQVRDWSRMVRVISSVLEGAPA